MSSACTFSSNKQSVLWVPIDLYLEDVMDGSQVRAISAAETLKGMFNTVLAQEPLMWVVDLLILFGYFQV